MKTCPMCEGSGYLIWERPAGSDNEKTTPRPTKKPDLSQAYPKGVGLCIKCHGQGRVSDAFG